MLCRLLVVVLSVGCLVCGTDAVGLVLLVGWLVGAAVGLVWLGLLVLMVVAAVGLWSVVLDVLVGGRA